MLTNEILCKDVQQSKETSEETLNEFSSHSAKAMRRVFGASITTDDMAELQSAIEPHISIVQDLHLQEAQYSLEMLPALEDDLLVAFDAREMDDMNNENKGVLQASVFPVVLKRVLADNSEVSRSLVLIQTTLMS